ncbi:MAG TPA: PilC/PilY family type IV pilus protein [Gammaproteobacteria bacterium]
MNTKFKRSFWTVIGVSWAVLSGLPAVADDTELFVADVADLGNAQPNILFILDTSGSMSSQVSTQSTYDPSVSYSGDCETNRVYWRTGTGNPPDCDTIRWFNASAFTCDAAMQAFALGTGTYTDRMAQFDPGSDDRWERISSSQKSRYVECEDDEGIHGQTTGDPDVYPRNGDGNNPWTNSANQGINWGQSPADRLYTVYEGNYINWFYGPTATSTRIQVMKDVSTSLLNSVNGVNVGLMRFNNNEGGPVIHAMEDISTARSAMQTKINNLPASGFTPLSETLYEAGLYYMGGNVDYGNVGDPDLSVAESRIVGNPSTYDSPLELSCQKSFIVLLTDGAPTLDVSANGKITGLPDYADATGSTGCDGSGDGRCLDDMAAYLFNADLSPEPGQQNVVTYTIGFTVDLPLLADTAAEGGGAYFTANDTASLSTALTSIVTEILDTATTFTAPSVSVNSFNRTRNLNDLFISVFQASSDVHWPGNLKKYRLRPSDGEILDANGNLAVDPATGFFADTSQSFWSAVVDGASVNRGGAASRLPDPVSRNIFTYLGNSQGAIERTNTDIDDSLLGTGGAGDPTRDQVIDYIRGLDVTDVDQDNNSSEPRNQMGDPLHAQPISVIYGGTPGNPDITDAAIYFATNDGVLHSIDPNTGVENWAFLPEDFLPDQIELFKNDSSPDKHYGVDGSLRTQFVLKNQDGVIDYSAGERVYLYFGMRRGGDFYYGLDVSRPDSPALLWRIDGATLTNNGQSWSAPIPTRVAAPGVNAEQLVLIFGGGYDTTQDNANGGTDTEGNAIHMVDSLSGNVLWEATSTEFADMQYSIPGDIRVLDIDGDGLADHMYAGDMGGQVWRFDIFNGQADLVNGGVIAQLGSAPNTTPSAAESRRFYYAPDVALTSDEFSSFLHIGVGSGHRAHPNSVFTQDRFYALRDYEPFDGRSQAFYNGLTPITEADLIDITDDVSAAVPAGSAGWKFELRDGGWRGEKVLAEARTFNNQVFFTTFTPGGGALTNGCQPTLGTNRLYIVDLLTGAPVNNLDGSADEENLTETDRYREFRGSISSEVVFLFPSPDENDFPPGEECVGDECTPPPLACVGLFCFPPGFGNAPIRTFWSQETTQ